MPTALTWPAIVMRLLLTAACAAVLGFNRDERGRSAGLRTNMLVALAACLAMIEANSLINTIGKTPTSFVQMDVMRLPLGILSGIGFIGAGAILKRGELVVGVTTAATLWFITVMGLCFGGGQIGLGFAGFVLGCVVLIGLKKIETGMFRRHTANLRITVTPDGFTQEELASLLLSAGISPTEPSLSFDGAPNANRVYGWRVQWKGRHEDTNLPVAVQALAVNPRILKLEFTR
ncbi:MAG TPA: MgtC/SapB family protein [Candidatus Sulfotelmatobacter sp.]|nr:MgtC/SapB family protein [Candidatus Sulfotelmatobacter sp.]